MRRLAPYVPIVLLLALIVFLGWNVHLRAVVSETQRSDFIMLRAAGRAVIDGTDIYRVRHPRGWPFYYPPTMAVLMVPFAAMPLSAAVLAWYAIGMGAVLWAGYRLVRLCDELAGRPVGPIVVAAFLVNFAPTISGLQRGQVSALLTALMVEAFWSYRTGRDARAGLWIALAASLKVYPALLILPAVVRRDGWVLAGFVVGLVLLLVLLPMAASGPAPALASLRAWTGEVALPFFTDAGYARREVFGQFNQFSPSNQSLFGVLSRWLARGAIPANETFPPALADLSPGTVRRIGLAMSLPLLLAMAAVARRSAARTDLREAALWALGMVAMNFISHIAWHHYYTSLTMLYALAGIAPAITPPGKHLWRLGGALAVAVVANWLHFAVFFCRQMGLLLLGSLALWIVMAIVAAGPTRGGNPAPAAAAD